MKAIVTGLLFALFFLISHGCTKGEMKYTFTEAQNPGALDFSFGTQGRTVLAVGDDDYIFETCLDGDLIYAVGKTGLSYSVTRFLSGGSLDTTFATNGTYAKTLDTDATAFGCYVTESKLLVGGDRNPSGPQSNLGFLVRFDESGVLDSTWGTNGLVQTAFSVKHVAATPSRIVAGGFGSDYLLPSPKPAGAIVQGYSALGQPGSFGGEFQHSVDTGIDPDCPDRIRAMKLSSNGTVVMAGYTSPTEGTSGCGGGGPGKATVLHRFSPIDGKKAGVLTVPFPGTDSQPYALLITPEAKALIGGYAIDSGVRFGALALYTGAPALDLSFDDDGILLLTLGNNNSIVTALARQTDGKFLIGGMLYPPPEGEYGLNPLTDERKDIDSFVIRLNPNGTFDSSFSDKGLMVFDFSGTQEADVIRSMQVTAEGKLIVAGTTKQDGKNRYFLARLHL